MSAVLMLDTNAASAVTKRQATTLTTVLAAKPFCLLVMTEAEMRYGLARRQAMPTCAALSKAFSRRPTFAHGRRRARAYTGHCAPSSMLWASHWGRWTCLSPLTPWLNPAC
jgi:hypothetical protein